ncbi:MAG: hypothetical protein QM726_12565 [Chitinophagaceae bacterium]
MNHALRHFLIFQVLLLAFCRLSAQADKPLSLANSLFTLSFDKDGRATDILLKKDGRHKAVVAYTEIEKFSRERTIAIPSADKQSIRFEHDLYAETLEQRCKLIETFSVTANSIRWQIEIAGTNKEAKSWSSIIKTIVQYPKDNDTRFWTSWGAPQFDSANCDPALIASLSPYKNNVKGWLDPLVPMPFSNQTMYYGAPPFDTADTKLGFIPSQGNLFAIPFASVFDKNTQGFSVFLSPEDNIINLQMKTRETGIIEFDRMYNRISNGKKISFSLDLAVHENDWRSALQWFADHYPDYTKPVNKQAKVLGGTAAYSNFFDAFDSQKMKRMAFTVNWQASFDFPYMGMFLPPVNRTTKWTRLGGGSISIKEMDDYAATMKKKGFYVMSYFNVTEFGSWFKYPCATNSVSTDTLWKDCSAYLCKQFPNALLKVGENVNRSKLDKRTIASGPYYSWKDAVATDCGDSAYKKFLLQQAQRHIREIPNSFGICIDRLDWLRFFNEQADDGISWFNGKPARSLVSSWKALMEELGPMMHHAGKYILVNNHYKRIDLLKHADGILDEFTNETSPLNTTAFLTLDKPALGWTPDKGVIDAVGGDNFFQKYLYLGVFPMCPFPGNDHALQPDSSVDKLYLDYGPLMNQLKEKRWVLKVNVISVKDDKAKVNLFATKSGYAIPVVYGKEEHVTIVLQDKALLAGNFVYKVYQPGISAPVTIKSKRVGATIELNVPLVRGAAMVSVSKL